MAEFGVCNRDPEAYKAETISYPVLDKEQLNDLRWTDEAASTELGHSPGCDLRRRSSPWRMNLNSRSLWLPFSADLKKKSVYLFWAALGLCRCAFSGCGEAGLRFIAWASRCRDFLVAKHGLQGAWTSAVTVRSLQHGL